MVVGDVGELQGIPCTQRRFYFSCLVPGAAPVHGRGKHDPAASGRRGQGGGPGAGPGVGRPAGAGDVHRVRGGRRGGGRRHLHGHHAGQLRRQDGHAPGVRSVRPHGGAEAAGGRSATDRKLVDVCCPRFELKCLSL